MRKIKKAMALFLALLMVTSAFLIQTSATSDIPVASIDELHRRSDTQGYMQVVQFEEATNGIDLCDEDIVSQRLQQMGLSLNAMYNLPDESLEIIRTAQKAVVSFSYFTEKQSDYMDEPELVEISREEFNRLSAIEYELAVPMLIGEQANYDNSSMSFGDVVANRGGGTVALMNSIFHSPTAEHPGRYLAMAEFFWSQMPTSRRTDFLALGRGAGYIVLGNNFSGWSGYWNQRLTFRVSGSQVHASGVGDPAFSGWSNHTNELRPAEGAAIRMNVPSDNFPHSIMPGQALPGTQRLGFQGGVSYIGTLTHIQPGVFNFNHYSAYKHQSGVNFSVGGPSINVGITGPSVSFSLSSTVGYAAPVDNVLTTRWTIR